MSSFSCPVVKVESVENHPNADRLSLVRLEGLGYLCISGKLEDGSPRYKAGDWVVYIPSAAVLHEWLLKEMDFWNDETGKGTLAGPTGDRVKPLKLRGIFSEGVLYPAKIAGTLNDGCSVGVIETPCSIDPRLHDLSQVKLGDNVADLLGITKYEPPIPTHMAGEVANMFDHTVRYDFERIEFYTSTEWTWIPDNEWDGTGEVDHSRAPPV